MKTLARTLSLVSLLTLLACQLEPLDDAASPDDSTSGGQGQTPPGTGDNTGLPVVAPRQFYWPAQSSESLARLQDWPSAASDWPKIDKGLTTDLHVANNPSQTQALKAAAPKWFVRFELLNQVREGRLVALERQVGSQYERVNSYHQSFVADSAGIVHLGFRSDELTALCDSRANINFRLRIESLDGAVQQSPVFADVDCRLASQLGSQRINLGTARSAAAAPLQLLIQGAGSDAEQELHQQLVNDLLSHWQELAPAREVCVRVYQETKAGIHYSPCDYAQAASLPEFRFVDFDDRLNASTSRVSDLLATLDGQQIPRLLVVASRPWPTMDATVLNSPQLQRTPVYGLVTSRSGHLLAQQRLLAQRGAAATYLYTPEASPSHRQQPNTGHCQLQALTPGLAQLAREVLGNLPIPPASLEPEPINCSNQG